jgi:hypothetical protein
METTSNIMIREAFLKKKTDPYRQVRAYGNAIRVSVFYMV